MWKQNNEWVRLGLEVCMIYDYCSIPPAQYHVIDYCKEEMVEDIVCLLCPSLHLSKTKLFHVKKHQYAALTWVVLIIIRFIKLSLQASMNCVLYLWGASSHTFLSSSDKASMGSEYHPVFRQRMSYKA